MEKAIQNIPPMIGSGMVMKMALSLEKIPKNSIITPAAWITLLLATLIKN